MNNDNDLKFALHDQNYRAGFATDCRPKDAYSLNRNDACSREHGKRGFQGALYKHCMILRFGPIVLSFWFMIFLNLQ